MGRVANCRRYAPVPALDVSKWSEDNVQIPIGNAMPGPISFRDMPYQRGILDAVEDPNIRRISLRLGAQLGKTMLALCVLAYYAHHKPRSQILMQPSQSDLRTWLETKFNPVIDANPSLKTLYAKPRGREGVNNQLMKSFTGGWLMFSWAGSPNTARGRSAPIIVCDEVDGYNYTAEGHPVELLWERASTFGSQRLLIEMSTPTIAGESRIDRSFAEGDQRVYEVCCFHCAELQALEWEQVKWDTVEGEDGNEVDLPETATLYCKECGVGYDDSGRMALVREAEAQGGGWRPTKETREHASFHLNVLYSPLRRLEDIVTTYLSAVKHRSMQTFENTCLAKSWEESGEKGDADRLSEQCESYEAQVPEPVKVLTAGVDVQADRIEFEVVGWGEGEESWNVDYQVIRGKTDGDSVWLKLQEALQTSYEHESDKKMDIKAVGIDAGYNSQSVYKFLSHARQPNWYALKGGRSWDADVWKVSRGRVYKGRRLPDLYTLNVNQLKRTVMRRLNENEPGVGYCHFPAERDFEYFDQLTAEHLVTTFKRGFPQQVWEKRQGQERNEAFDCRVYAYGALLILNPNMEQHHFKEHRKFFGASIRN